MAKRARSEVGMMGVEIRRQRLPFAEMVNAEISCGLSEYADGWTRRDEMTFIRVRQSHMA
jgi:hypothetical protein